MLIVECVECGVYKAVPEVESGGGQLVLHAVTLLVDSVRGSHAVKLSHGVVVLQTVHLGGVTWSDTATVTVAVM